jgi:hypothetical protein
MEIDLKDKLVQLEAQVAAIKDPALRQIAFQRLLDTVVQPPSTSHADRTKKKQKASGNQSPRKSKGLNKASAFYSTAQVRDEVQKLTLTGTAKDLPNFRDMKKGWQSYMWVLAAAKQSKIDGLNNHEIAYLLSKRLYKPTKYTTVNNIHNKVGSGFVCQDPETQRWMITPEGETYLQTVTKK